MKSKNNQNVGTILIKSTRHRDNCGYVGETYSGLRCSERRINVEFVRDNHLLSHMVGALRGLHFQTLPHVQGKMVRCGRWAIFDFAMDIRRGSTTYRQWEDEELPAENGHQLYVPLALAWRKKVGYQYSRPVYGPKVAFMLCDFAQVVRIATR
ncbi:dTDP-4-dehydrorhamnose 3,5-epimerase family protein [Planktomarina temperata]|nr:dTDP-4-dehydrorhamnose 3,5-epimerase family protein [Planktomarina temperata]